MTVRVDGYRVTRKNGKYYKTKRIEFTKICSSQEEIDQFRSNIRETYRESYPGMMVWVDLFTTNL